MRRSARSAFTLLELLIVISIFSLLMQLLIPAVQSARAAARNLQCRDNLRQIALASTTHEERQGHFPTGGWSSAWLGDPDRGFGKRQPGGWAYTLLPFMDENRLFALGRGQSAVEKQRAALQLCTTPRSGMNCPSRRNSGPHAIDPRRRPLDFFQLYDSPGGLVRSDYAMNAGSLPVTVIRTNYGLPATFDQADDPDFEWPYPDPEPNGVSYHRSEVRAAQVSDGLSNTYLVGEKVMPTNHYFDGEHPGDNGSMYSGFDYDTHRWANRESPPHRDQEDNGDHGRFGSVHVNGFNMAFCDGSVHHIAYSIDPSVHEYSANRKDGEVVSGGTQ